MSELTDHELDEITRVNDSKKQPVLFVHGLWMLPASWRNWEELFATHGFVTLSANWPNDPTNVDEARSNPQLFAGHSVADIEKRISLLINKLDLPPILIGHSFGGLLVQKLAGDGLSLCTIAIDPAPMKGVLPLPGSVLKANLPVLLKPSNRTGAITLTQEKFRFVFGNAISAEESNSLHKEFAVPTPGKPLFEAAFANFNPKAGTKVDLLNSKRGPLLIISGEMDNAVPRSLTSAAFKLQGRNENKTEFIEIAGRGHSLVIDKGWPEVADIALKFIHENVAD